MLSQDSPRLAVCLRVSVLRARMFPDGPGLEKLRVQDFLYVS
jgi:hypothetical protein